MTKSAKQRIREMREDAEVDPLWIAGRAKAAQSAVNRLRIRHALAAAERMDAAQRRDDLDRYLSTFGAAAKPTRAGTGSAPAKSGRSLSARRDSLNVMLGVSLGLRDDTVARRKVVDTLLSARPGDVVQTGTGHEVTVRDTGFEIHRTGRAATGRVEVKAYGSAPRVRK
jgi:hypothetical protein